MRQSPVFTLIDMVNFPREVTDGSQELVISAGIGAMKSFAQMQKEFASWLRLITFGPESSKQQ